MALPSYAVEGVAKVSGHPVHVCGIDGGDVCRVQDKAESGATSKCRSSL